MREAYKKLESLDATYTPQEPTIKESIEVDTSFADNIKEQNKNNLTPALALEGLKELYPFISDSLNVQHLLGWSKYYDSLTFEFPNLSINRMTPKGKWIVTKGNNRDFIPYNITDDSKEVFLYSGMAEIIAMENMGLDYIGLQMDSADKNISKEIKKKMKGKTLVVIEENDGSSAKLSQRLKEMFNFIKIIKIGQSKDYGYDLRDFVNEQGSFEKAKDGLKFISQITALEKPLIKDEIRINYKDKYISNQDEIDIGTIESGVIVALTGAGKTYSFKDRAGYLILVTRVEQTTLGKGDDGEYVINKILAEGGIMTYEKFLGHYLRNGEFKHYIDSKKIKVVVDEAQEVQNLKNNYEIIYKLDAIFLSGTIESFFRTDLQRYKFIPEKPMIIHFTLGQIPDFKNALYFADKAKALKANYPDRCIVGAEHNFPNFNIHNHEEGKVFATSALREGVSIDTHCFEACIVDVKSCGLWSIKQQIQAVNRPRGDDVLKIVTAPPKPNEKIFTDFQWYLAKAKEVSSTQEINTIMGEEYSNFIKMTHKSNEYLGATEFGIVCYLHHKTRNNYDPELYEFKEYIVEKEFEMNKKVKQGSEEIVMFELQAGDSMYEVPSNRVSAFNQWKIYLENGVITQVLNMMEFENLGLMYQNSNFAEEIKKNYNAMFGKNNNNKKYNIKLFYDFLKKIVTIEKTYLGKTITNLSKNLNLKEIKIKIVNACPIKGVTKLFKTDDFSPTLSYKDKGKKILLDACSSVKIKISSAYARNPLKKAKKLAFEVINYSKNYTLIFEGIEASEIPYETRPLC
jgi:hypothetical protein